jgi:hypothetical protein
MRSVPRAVVALALLSMPRPSLATPDPPPKLKAFSKEQLEAMRGAEEAARRQHHGAGPCLRYPEPVPNEVLTAVAEDLRRAGIATADLNGMFARFDEWAEASEQPAHRFARDEEMYRLAGVTPGQGKAGKAVARQKRYERELRRKLLEKAAATEARLAPEKRAAFRAAWQREPRALLLPNIMKVGLALNHPEPVGPPPDLQQVCPPPPLKASLPLARVRRAIADPSQVGARFVPAIVDDAMVGLKIFAIGRDSLLDQAGFCNGDIVRAVNGRKLANPEAMMEASRAMQREVDFRFDVLRAGTTIELRVSLVGD